MKKYEWAVVGGGIAGISIAEPLSLDITSTSSPNLMSLRLAISSIKGPGQNAPRASIVVRWLMDNNLSKLLAALRNLKYDELSCLGISKKFC